MALNDMPRWGQEAGHCEICNADWPSRCDSTKETGLLDRRLELGYVDGVTQELIFLLDWACCCTGLNKEKRKKLPGSVPESSCSASTPGIDEIQGG
ncbi:hypothetical protein MATL_G00162910 [Megalops atlanticus]|uniref:Uncharacterized protein n=1 Tax=Megalops atlanticus TaxID=7932 RepID=A0A9D3PT32_MEGAT|nr:hypothetical protein MATL_G00162910 [Megalops atlanticus]